LSTFSLTEGVAAGAAPSERTFVPPAFSTLGAVVSPPMERTLALGAASPPMERTFALGAGALAAGWSASPRLAIFTGACCCWGCCCCWFC
jgi:hypothetical protein